MASCRQRFIGYCLGLLAASFAALPAFAQIPSALTDKARWDKIFDGAAIRPNLGVLPPVFSASQKGETSPLVKEILKAQRSNRMNPVWPGYNPLDQPILIYEAGIRSFLIAHPNPPPGYKAVQARPHTVFEKPGEVEDLDFIFQFHRDVNGTDTFAYRVNPNSDMPENLDTIIHERFHVFQDKKFKGPPSWSRHIEPSAEILAMAALEQKALEKALGAGTPQEVARYTRLFIAIRSTRYQGPSMLQEVDAGQERTEGMAEYITSVLLYRKGFPKAGESGRGHVIDRLRRFPDVNSLKKGRHYGTGAAQGYILDEGGPADWKKRVTAGEAPFDIVKESYPVPGNDRPALLAEAKTELGYPALLAKAAKINGGFQKAKTQAIADYAALPGIELQVSIPWSPDNSVSMGHSSEGPSYQISEHETLHPGAKMVSVSWTGFKMLLTDTPVIFSGSVAFHMGSSKIIADGKPLDLKDGSYEFKSLEVTGPGVSIESSNPGSLIIHGGKADILWP